MKAKTFKELQEEAYILVQKIQKEIIEVAKELEYEEYKRINIWGDKIEIDSLGFEKPKIEGASPYLHYLNEIGEPKRPYKYSLNFHLYCSNTLKRTKCRIGDVWIIDATTKQDYQEYIDNFEQHKEETIQNFRNRYIEPTKELKEEFKENIIKAIRSNKQELIKKYQDNLDFLDSIE